MRYCNHPCKGKVLKITQADQAIGTGSFPDYPTRQWHPGQIVKDTYFLRMPADAPTPVGLTLLVAAYHQDTGERLGETWFGTLPLTLIEPLVIPPDAQIVNASIGSAKLNAYTIHDEVLTLYWEAGVPMTGDIVVFVHLFDVRNNFVAGSDSRPRRGLYPPWVWQPGEGIVDEHTLLATSAGPYILKIGMYDAVTQARLPVVTAKVEEMPDGVLGKLEVK